MDKWKEKFRRFMIGRYGMDELNRFLMAAVLVIIVADVFLRIPWNFWAEALLLILCYLRMFSKNINARFRENQKFLNIQFRVTEQWKKWGFQWKEARKYKIFKCPNCGQKIRIPRGHGKISIHCRKCGQDFMGKS